jgi:hypothetical protein
VDKKRIAALMAVLYYVRGEKERERFLSERLVKPYSMASRWAMYGRRTIMQRRSRVQSGRPGNHLPIPLVKDTVSCKSYCPTRVRNLVISTDSLLVHGRVYRNCVNTSQSGRSRRSRRKKSLR